MYGPILSLEFDEFKVDTTINPLTKKRGEHIEADCNCIFEIVWKITGLKTQNKYILLLNGQLESIYQKREIDDLLESYQIETHNSTYAFLSNAIDKKGLRQGIHTFKEDNVMSWGVFVDGKKQTNP
jgi:hypothetical protein